MKFKYISSDPVVAALQHAIRRKGLARVAYDLNCCESYIHKMAYGISPMSRFVADKLGFEMVITFRKREK